jgi:hypothetical protein
MKSAAFKDCIEDYVKEYPPNQPIYTTRVAEKLAEKYHLQKDQAKKLVNVNLKRLFDKNIVERFQKGIYYKTIPTPFGNTRLNPTHIVRDQYILKNGDIIGYETDASFLNHIGLTTQMPRYTYIATNLSNRGNERKEKLHIILRKPSTEVTKDNYLYLQILDAIENKNKISIDAKNPSRIYLSYILDCKLDSIKLIAFASKFYPKRVLEKFIEIAKSTI